MKKSCYCPRLLGALLAFLFVGGSLPIDSQASVAVTSAPVIETPAAQTASNNVALTFSTTNGNAITLTNLDPGADLVQLTLSATQGTLTLNGTNGLAFTTGDGVADATMTVRGTFTNLSTALNGLRFTPTTDYFGAATLTVSGFNATPVVTNLTNGLQGHYTFDNTSALGADTSPPGTRSGAVTGGTAAVDPWRFKVINLDAAGGADYVQVSGRFGNPASVTLAAWVKLTTAPSAGAEVISLGDSAVLRVDNLGDMEGFIFDGIFWRSFTYAATLAGTGWRHVAYTFDDAGNQQRLYLDGVEVANLFTLGSIVYSLGANSFIGKHGNASTTHNFTGRIDDARVYNRALSAGEIAGLASDLNPNLSTTNSVSITVVGPPAITSQPASQWGVEGSNVAFTVTAAGTAPLSYRWAYNGTDISGATNSTLDLTSIALSDGGNYTVIVTNAFGSVTSQVAVLTVLSLPPILAAKDTYIRSAAADLNYGASSSLVLDSSNSGLGNQRVLLEFDLSAIPVGSVIVDARLVLEATSIASAPVNVEVHQITQYWEEGSRQGSSGATSWAERIAGSSWNTPGGSFDSAVVASLNTSATGQHSWNVTTLVQSWVTAGSTNYGLLLGSPDSGSRRITYDSREGTTPPELRVSFVAPPAITSQPESQTIYAGTNVAFSVAATGTGPFSYQWKSNSVSVAGATNSSLNLSNVAMSASGNYAVVVSNAGGSVTSLVAVLSVQAVPPMITSQPVGQTVNEGANVSFSVTATGTAPLSYQWARNAANIAGATNSTLNLNNVAMSAGGNYSVLIQNSGGFVASAAATLTVQPAPPTITVQPVSRTVNEGTNVSFAVSVTGTAPLAYQWTLAGTNLSGASGASLNLSNVALSASGSYAVIVTNIAGSVTSQVAVLTVQPVAPTITSQPVGNTINDGDNVSFAVTAAGTAPLSYQWRQDGNAIGDATNATLNLSNVPLSGGGNYTVVVTNVAGSVTSQVAVLTVQGVQVAITVKPASQTVAVGSTVTLSVAATGTAPLTYQWERNGLDLPGENSSTLTITNVQAADAGSYKVKVDNVYGPTRSSANAVLSVIIPTLAMTDNLSLEINSTNFTGLGQSSNTLATIEVNEPLHDDKSGGKSMWYSWQAPAAGIATFSTAGSDFDTLLAVYQGDAVESLVPVASDDDSAGFYNSEVQFNVVSNGVYRIAVDGAGGASGNILLRWSLEETTDVLPVITNQPADRVVSLTSNGVFTVGVRGAGVTYQWFFNNVAVPDGTNSVWTQAGVGLGDVGFFKVQATIGTRTVTSRPVSLGITLAPALEQDFLAADKFSATISSGRRLRLDPPPSASFSRLPPDVAATSRGYSGSQVFSTVGSLKEPGEPDHCGVPGGASRWFAFEAETDGVLELNTDGSTFDTILAVYTGTNANFAELTSVACDNDSGTNGQTSSLHFLTTSGTTYYIAVDGVNGASGTVVLNYTTLGEQQRPSITVTSAPPANVGLTNDTVTISGIATDNADLIAVQWRMTNSLGSTTWTNATGTNEWTFVASNLAFGRNAIQIRSLDSWGNYSATNSINYLRLAPVTVTVDGCGSVSAGFLGTTYREPGKSFSITATPCANSLFAGWTGDRTTNAKTINVLIQTGLVVQASFMTNPFALRPGTYVGLFYETNVVGHDSSGLVTVRTTAKGTYSGKLRIGTKNRSFSGYFGIDGLATNSVSRGGTNPPLRVELNFNLGQLVQSVAGRVIDTNWTAELTAFRAVFHSRTNPSPYQGRYTLLLPANGMPGAPEGDGYGAVTVSPNGSVRLSGALADGTTVSQGAPVSREGVWPFYVPLRSGRGSIWSWLTFETNSAVFGTNTVQTDLAGDVRWFSPALVTARYYPDGFTNALDAVGSRYLPPPSSTNGALTFGDGTVLFTGINLSESLTNDVLRAANDRVTDLGTNDLTLTILRPNGLFRGSVVVPGTGRKVPFKGALFQNGDFGSGYFLQTNTSGPVWFGPRQ